MRYRDKTRFVRQNMKKNKTRVFMTVLATAIGCAFLIVLASVGFGLQRSVVDNITDGRLLTDIEVHGKRSGDNVEGLVQADIAALEAIGNVKAVTRKQGLYEDVRYKLGELERPAPTYAVYFPEEVKAGFELSKGRMPQAEDEVIVGYNFAKDANGELIGRQMEMKVADKLTVNVTVVGIGKAPAREWREEQDVLISEELLATIKKGLDKETEPAQYNEVHVYATKVQKVESIVNTLNEQSYLNYSITNQVDQVNTLFTIMKIGLIIVGTIALLIASIGIYNTMTMAVTERSQDIGIMKAIGAHPSTIKSVFLIESSYIGLMGAAIGTVAAYAVSYVVNWALPIVIRDFLNQKPPEGLQFSYIPLSLTLLCIAISLAVAVLSGMRPAMRATKVDVLKALRRDI